MAHDTTESISVMLNSDVLKILYIVFYGSITWQILIYLNLSRVSKISLKNEDFIAKNKNYNE